jgi:hypothetical protein
MTWDSVLPLLGAVILGVLAFLFGKRMWKKDQESSGPPKNSAASAARETIQKTFEEEVDGIRDSASGDDPAGDLADHGNARSR